MRKKSRKWLAIAVACAALGTGAVVAFTFFSGQGDREKVYRTAQVQRRDIAAVVQATGVIRAKVGAEVKVGARISGRVERLFANIGDTVRKGQMVAQIEQKDLKARVGEIRMNLKIAQANLELHQKNLQRMQNLFAMDYVSRDKVDVAERDLKATRAQVEQIRESILYHETQMSYANIHAPIAGVIASVATQQGETVSASAQNVPTFVTIVDLGRLEIYAYVDETDIGRMRPSLEATFTVDAFPDKEFSGSVSAVYPKATIQDNVVYYITLVSIANPEGKLKPDMTVKATIFLDKRRAVLAVPGKAIKRDKGRKFVQVLQHGKPVEKTIKTGWKDGAFTEVLSGLAEGEQVIIAEVAGQTAE